MSGKNQVSVPSKRFIAFSKRSIINLLYMCLIRTSRIGGVGGFGEEVRPASSQIVVGTPINQHDQHQSYTVNVLVHLAVYSI